MKSSTSQPVANFLIVSFCSFLNSPRIKSPPSAGSQTIIERMLCVITSVLFSTTSCQLVAVVRQAGSLSVLKDLYQIERHRHEQSNHHHEGIVLCETGLRRAHDRRHQAHNKIGNRVH